MQKLGPEIISLIVDQLGTVNSFFSAQLSFECEFLGRDSTCARLSPYATISRAWQHEVERRCFKSLKLHSADMHAWSEILSAYPWRRRYLRRLEFACYHARMPKPEWPLRDLLFRADVVALLTLLKQWDDDDERAGIAIGPTLQLVLDFFPMSMEEVMEVAGSELTDAYVASDASDPPLHSGEWTLPEDPSRQSLPLSRRVLEFSFLEYPLNYVDPTTIAQIAAAFPQLQSLHFPYTDPPIGRHDARLGQRDAFVRAFNWLRGRLPCRKKLTIPCREHHFVLNHSFECQELTDEKGIDEDSERVDAAADADPSLESHYMVLPQNCTPEQLPTIRHDCQDSTDEEGIDPLSEAIRKLAQPTVQELSLGNVLLSRDLFLNWRSSSGAQNDDDDDVWVALRRLQLSAEFVAPDGTWYTKGDPSSVEAFDNRIGWEIMSEAKWVMVPVPNTEDEQWGYAGSTSMNGEAPYHPWGRSINNKTMEPLLGDWTEAVLHRMPRLEEVIINLFRNAQNKKEPLDGIPRCKRGVRYAPRLVLAYLSKGASTASPQWQCLITRYETFREWTIPPNVEAHWKQWAGEKGFIVVDTGGYEY
ncbi:hypothetical protein PG994_004079 [Apiospora phragmitis]|uniref:Uncharacterized protein n=1 Tax=Apiospora phragmitis TaxID=2905665 RepID=A0ABR1VPK4_9PEZI